MDALLHVTVVTPERAVLPRTACSSVTLPAEKGEMQVLPGHAALVTLLGIGIATVQDGGKAVAFAVRGGFAEIGSDEVRVLADTATAPDGVDAAVVKKELAEAGRRLADVQGEDDLEAAGAEVRYAEARLALGGR